MNEQPQADLPGIDTTPTIADLLAERRAIGDQIDEVNEVLSKLSEAKSNVERRIMDAMNAAGMEEDGAKVSANGITATMQHKWRARYSPDLWPAIIQWAGENGHADIVQRRLTDSKIVELFDSGAAFPEGLTMEPYRQLAFRRNNG